MVDDTEDIRRALVNKINSNPSERQLLEDLYGQVWDTNELSNDFIIEGFLAPWVIATRKSDGKKGCLEFQHRPRLYYNWMEE
jgi:hypothetical protein